MMRRARRLWPLGIRAQLTLLYTAVFALLIALFGCVFYFVLSSSLANSFDSALQVRTQAIAAGVSYNNGAICIQDVSVGLPSLTSGASSGCDVSGGQTTGGSNATGQAGPQSSVDVGTLVRIVNAQGKAVYISPDFTLLSVPAGSVSQPLTTGTPWTGTVQAGGGHSVRLYSAPLADNGTIYGVVQVGQSLASVGSTLRSVTVALLLITPFVLLLAALGSYAMAGRAFRPVTRLTRTARTIEAGDLHQRVPVPPSRDEVRDLALTLNAMIARLEASFAQQRRFVADASHELRTPVAVLEGLAEVTLAQAATPEEYAAALRDVVAEAERLGALVADLLLLSRADEGQLPIDREPVRLDLLAADVVASVELLADERGVTLRAEPLEPATVLGDAARLIQVIMNLVDNAIAYTNAGGDVGVSVTSNAFSARLAVHDTGIGIAPEDQTHIFERFYRADPARSRTVGGNGLGLSIVDWVVRAHGGAIQVTSTLGKGSTFTVNLPLAPAAQLESSVIAPISHTGDHQLTDEHHAVVDPT
jgi:two-component system OmpR family sensor kinase